MSPRYLVLKGVNAFEVHGHSGFYAMGLPAMTAFAGLMHALQLRTQPLLQPAPVSQAAQDAAFDTFLAEGEPSSAGADALQFTGISPVIEKYVFDDTQLLRVTSSHALRGKAGAPAPMSYDPVVNLGLSLVLRVESEASSDELVAFFGSKEFRVALCSCRLSGASLNWSGAFELTDSFEKALYELPGTGLALEDASAAMALEMDENGGDAVVAMGTLTARYRAGKSENKPIRPRYVALGTGFRAIEAQARQRPGARYGAPHRYVESVVGLARVRLVASLRRSVRKGAEPRLLWNYELPTPNGFYMTAGSFAR